MKTIFPGCVERVLCEAFKATDNKKGITYIAMSFFKLAFFFNYSFLLLPSNINDNKCLAQLLDSWWLKCLIKVLIFNN